MKRDVKSNFDNNKIPVKKLWQVIMASSVGTVIEWYDFYIFGSLSAIISVSFFPKEDPTAAFISTLVAFGAGFVARPFGGIIFGKEDGVDWEGGADGSGIHEGVSRDDY